MKFPPDIAKCPSLAKGYLLRLGLILLAGLFLLPGLEAQSRKRLEQRRKQLIADIQVTSNLLKKTSVNRAAALDRYVALQQQIKSREALLLPLAAEINLADSLILRNTGVIEALEGDIEQLQNEYAIMAQQAQRMRMSNSRLLFLFSADGFSDAFRRWQYLRQYDNYRQRQARLILSTQQTLADKVGQLEEQRLKKEVLLRSELEQQGLLEEEVSVKSGLLASLQQDEARLKKDLEKKRLAHQKLNSAIEKIIREEIIAQRKRARSPPALPRTEGSSDSGTATTTSPADSKLSGEFGGQRGRLPWPVSSGVITSHFGKQAHPTLRRIQITNNGIDIQTNPQSQVKAVFRGEVVGLQFIPGYHYMVILRHGTYYTVYSNLDNVVVKKGDRVAGKQNLGQVATDSRSGKSEVHFEVWRDKQRLNPTDWVRRR